MRTISFIFFLTALLIRLIVVQIWRIPQIVYIPIELCLIITALYLERDKLPSYFVVFDRWKKDFFIGLVAGIIFCVLESLHLEWIKGYTREFRLDTLLLVPIGILLAGWRAGVYEELLFRSLAMGYLHRWSGSKFIAILGQGLLFWIAHLKYFNPDDDWGVSTLFFGLALGALTVYRGSVIPAMIAHAIGNSYGGAILPPGEYLLKALRSWL